VNIATRWELDSDAPRKLCLFLDHECTKKNLAFCNLKEVDKARVEVLLQSKAFDHHLALLERHKSGTPVCDHYGGGYHTMEDCDEDSTSVIKWINAQDSEVTLRGFDIDPDEEMLAPLFDSDAEPDREDYEGYTGNADPTGDYFYERAVLVIWPRSFGVRIVCSASFESAFQLARQRAKTKEGDAVKTLQEVINSTSVVWTRLPRILYTSMAYIAQHLSVL
jgi:hypothetical protein